ncbi:MAG TPA: hypothetical protein PKV73_02925 [Agriterribacter sp.]|nr:hypothetical protein [Agriterribacter sp.]
MLSTTHLVLLNLSIALPAIASLFRIRFPVRAYLPFLVFIWAGMLNDTVSLIMVVNNKSNLLNSNVYVLFEYFILLAQFAVWSGRSVVYYLLFAMIGLMVWLWDNVYLNEVTGNNSIFRFTYSMIIVFFSLDRFNKILIYEKAPLGKNPTFLICTGFILFFAIKGFLESFNIFNVGLSASFFRKIFFILSVVNLLANLLYTYAILCLTRKQEFTMPY